MKKEIHLRIQRKNKIAYKEKRKKRGRKGQRPPTIAFNIFNKDDMDVDEEEKKDDRLEEEKEFKEFATVYKSLLVKKEKLQTTSPRKLTLNRRLTSVIERQHKAANFNPRTPGLNIIGMYSNEKSSKIYVYNKPLYRSVFLSRVCWTATTS